MCDWVYHCKNSFHLIVLYLNKPKKCTWAQTPLLVTKFCCAEQLSCLVWQLATLLTTPSGGAQKKQDWVEWGAEIGYSCTINFSQTDMEIPNLEAGEMTQWLTAWTAFPKKVNLISNSWIWFHAGSSQLPITSTPGDLTPLVSKCICTHVAYTHR